MNKNGNVDVKVNETFECMDLSINDTYSDPEEPYFDDDRECVVVHYEYKSFD